MTGRTFVVLLAFVGTVVHAASLSDPTQPMSYVSPSGGDGVAPPTGPVLQSTLVATGRRVAIINGRSYGVGDTFEGAVVTEIQPYEVILNKNGRPMHLRLVPRLARDTAKTESQ